MPPIYSPILMAFLLAFAPFPPSSSSNLSNSPNSSFPPPPSPSIPPTSPNRRPLWDFVESKPIAIYPIKKFTVGTFPNPQDPFDHWNCLVDRPSHLCDPDSMLEKEDRMELQELITFFPEWTKNPISPNRCVQKGVRLGIALAQFPIEDGRPLFENTTQRQWRDWVQDGDVRRLIDVIWRRLNELGEDPKDQIGARIARDWGLVEGTFGCHLAILIMANAEPPQIHIYIHPSIPISPIEKKAIIAEQLQFLRNPSREYPRILRSILGSLRELVVHKQSVLIGESRAVPIGRKSKLADEQQDCKEKGAKIANAPIWHPPFSSIFQWLALAFSILFSFSSFLMAIFLFFRIRRSARRRNSVERGESSKCHCHKKHRCCLRMDTLEGK